jgi:hypothetical protein
MPDDLARRPQLDRLHGHAAFGDQPGAIPCPVDTFPRRRMEPANAVDTVAALEMAGHPVGNWQVPVEPAELDIQFFVNPVGASGSVQIPGRPEKARLHPAVGMDKRGYKPHIHDDFALACRQARLLYLRIFA